MYSIYGKTNCAYCEQAKSLLEIKGIEYEYKQLDKDFTREDIINKCAEYDYTPKQFPQIFKREDGLTQHIGGFTELKASL